MGEPPIVLRDADTCHWTYACCPSMSRRCHVLPIHLRSAFTDENHFQNLLLPVKFCFDPNSHHSECICVLNPSHSCGAHAMVGSSFGTTHSSFDLILTSEPQRSGKIIDPTAQVAYSSLCGAYSLSLSSS